MIQIRASDRRRVFERLAGIPAQVIGSAERARRDCAWCATPSLMFAAPRVELERTWSEVSFRMQQLRDDPGCAQEEFDRILDREDPGLCSRR